MNDKITIGITTWIGNISLNYGSVLQATAMQKLISDCGCNPITIDYRFRPKLKLNKRFLNFVLQLFRYGVNYIKTKRSFQHFINKNVKLSKRIYSEKELVYYAQKKLQVLLCGSDAIWHEVWPLPLFFWDYRGLEKFPKIAYAPSAPSGKLNYPFIKQALNGFVGLSGRETILKDLLAPFTNKNVSIVLDPTLAVDDDFWNSKCLKPLIKEPYIVGYFLSYASLHRISIEKIKKRYNVNKIVYINTNYIDVAVDSNLTDYKNENYRKPVGPREFLTLIKNSVAVCTDSYHGVAFSIIFQRNFYVFDRPMIQDYRSNCRLPDLFQRLGINERWVENNYCIDEMKEINWEIVNDRLQKEREHSISFLRRAIKESIEEKAGT